MEGKVKEYTFYAYDKTKYVIQLIDGKAIIDPPCGAMFALETDVEEIIAYPSVQSHNANISPKDFGDYLGFLEHGDASSINVNIKIYEGTFSLTIFPNGMHFPSRREL